MEEKIENLGAVWFALIFMLISLVFMVPAVYMV